MSASVPPQTPNAPADPSMEDILASIRRILSEDEPGAKPGEKLGDKPAEADVLRLDESMLVAEPTRPVARPAAPAPAREPPVIALAVPVEALPAPAAERPNAPAAERPKASAAERLMTPEAEAATASAVGSLLRTLETERPPPAPPVPVWSGGPTLEDLVREALRPMLKDWLDTNLPPLVERLVRAEIERVVSRPAR